MIQNYYITDLVSQNPFSWMSKILVCNHHEDDATSVTLLVSELHEELPDIVLVFKPKGSQSMQYPSLPEETFILALQTKFQMELYRHLHAPTSMCRFKLINFN